MKPNKIRKTRKPRKQGNSSLLWQGSKAVLAGGAACTLLLAVFALVLSRTSISLQYVPVFSCIAASAGAFVMAYQFANAEKKKYLLCGLLCGILVGAGVLIAKCLIDKKITIQILQALIPMEIALVLSGLAGGTASSLRRAH